MKKTGNLMKVQEMNGKNLGGKLSGNVLDYRKMKIIVDQIQYHGRE